MRGAPLSVVLLAACGSSGDLPPYYENRVDPSIDAIEPASEPGNAGGQTVTLRGSGFGTDAADLVVRFGQRNAEIVSVSDTELVVRSPIGPITGGPVDVTVATPKGFVECWAPNDVVGYDPGCDLHYTYATEADAPDGFSYTDQRHYVLVQNLWTSCYGGMYDNPEIAGCDTIAYFGQTGLDGVGEFYRFAYPRVHTTQQEFVTGADANPLEWRVVERFEQPVAAGVDDLKRTVGSFSLKNPLTLGDTYCVDMARDPADGEARTCQGIDIRRYDRGEVFFCEGEDAVSGGDSTYRADWPVKDNFFQGAGGDFDDVEILLDIGDPTAEVDPRLEDYPVTLPPPLVVRADAGFDDDATWAVAGMADCADGDGDGQATLDEDGVVLSWEPIPAGLLGPDEDKLLGVNTWVHVSVSYLNVGWFSGDGWGLRASVTVPDDWQYDDATGRASVGIPNVVLYQFPTPNPEWSFSNTLLQTGHLGTFEDEASFMLIEIYRVSDYRIETDAGELVFSYLTGDLTFPDWRNPAADGDDCSDCLDGDGDGWTDFADPDCGPGGAGVEDHLTTAFTCNDGLDNDGDLLVDADDPKCADGADSESNCGDGIDNDGDGWTDVGDGECDPTDPFAQEAGADDPSWTCSDGLDNDGDGWIDATDPACATGIELEDDGTTGTACNNSIDDDGDGRIDAADLRCMALGATGDSERPATPSTGCSDDLDNDGDGFFDVLDPDCEVPPATSESRAFLDPAAFPGAPECYDGLDNDGDGRTDADDPSCWNPARDFDADGFLGDESASQGTGCTDGLDGDSDGWVDGKDPDCQPGSAATQTEVGFGTTQCNDGIDNNEDDKIDAQSSYCRDGYGNFEGP